MGDKGVNRQAFFTPVRGTHSSSFVCEEKAETGSTCFSTKTQGERQCCDEPWDSRQHRAEMRGGRRTSTLRARVRAAKKYLGWLAVAADVSFPSEVSHLTGFLEICHSEHCYRGALKAADQCMAFLGIVAGVDEKELFSTAQPGRTPKQAPRYPVAVLVPLEELVLEESATFYFRVYAWCLLLQCWETLRFADHRGLNPEKDFEVKGNALTARLTCRPNLVAQAGPDFLTMPRQKAELAVVWVAGSSPRRLIS